MNANDQYNFLDLVFGLDHLVGNLFELCFLMNTNDKSFVLFKNKMKTSIR
jgi:hypothetical protein